MPYLETPPEEKTPAAPPETGPRKGGGRDRYNYLDTHELVMLLEDIDDERARARFREAMYLALILWLSLALLYIFLPRWLPHRPVLIVPQRNPNELTYLDTPPDLKKLLKNHPSPRISERSTEAQTPKPANVPRPPEPKAGTPKPRVAPEPTPRPSQATQPQAPQPQQPAQQPPPQQTAKVQPSPTPRPSSTPPLVDSPAPSQQKTPIFKSGGSAGSQIADAAKGARSGAPDAGDYGSTGRGNAGQGKAGVQVISDTQGVDFSRYLSRLLAEIRRNWLPLIPEEANSPLFKQGISGVRFTILPDGTIQPPMHLDYSTHDSAMDRAAWGSIKALGQAPPLPKEFHGPNLELRIEFRVNKDRDVQ